MLALVATEMSLDSDETRSISHQYEEIIGVTTMYCLDHKVALMSAGFSPL